jgi:hypothetical protein
MDTDFLHLVQRKGWQIVSVRDEAVIGRCPARGCNMVGQLAKGGLVPQVCKAERDRADIPVEVWHHIRERFLARRLELGLTIKEVEDIAGIAIDQLAKCERENGTRIPNFQTLMEWGMTLGFGFYLRPGPLPPQTLRVIESTRDAAVRRQKVSG